MRERIHGRKQEEKHMKGKRVLLISLSGYHVGIMKKLKEFGAEADYINDKPNDGFVCKSLGRYKAGFYQSIINRYYRQALEPLKDKAYDFILVIRGEYTPIETLKLLKKYYPDSRLILYMWDGLHKLNTKGIEKKWPYYDSVYTFDRIDCEQNKSKLLFLPLFYYDEYLPDNIKSPDRTNFKYDLSFIGTGHGDRIKIVKDAIKQCSTDGRRCFSYFFMPHPFVYMYCRMSDKNFRDVRLSDVCFQMMPFEKLYRIYANSRCVMDVEDANQHGLTMRSIEMLGLRRKLITTNKDIVSYDFYNPNNILILDRHNGMINMDFFEKPYETLDESIYQKYS